MLLPSEVKGTFKNERGFLSLIGLLIAIAIIAILAVMLLGGTGGKSGTGGGSASGVGGAIGVRDEARDEVCRNNLQQLRMAAQMAMNDEDGAPADIDDLAEAAPGISTTCPVGGEEYDFNPNTGQVKCVHPGHEKF